LGYWGYVARSYFVDPYIDVNQIADTVKDTLWDSYIEYLDSDPFTRPLQKPASRYKPGEYSWEPDTPCK
jgi:hypothetical protein